MCEIFAYTQYGYRTGCFPDEAIQDFTDFVVKKLDENSKRETIFIDLVETYDTVTTYPYSNYKKWNRAGGQCVST